MGTFNKYDTVRYTELSLQDPWDCPRFPYYEPEQGFWDRIIRERIENKKQMLKDYNNLTKQNMEEVTWKNIRTGGVYEIEGEEVRVLGYHRDISEYFTITRPILVSPEKEYPFLINDIKNLKRVPPQFKKGYLFPGDVATNYNGEQRIVGETSFLASDSYGKLLAGVWRTYDEAIKLNWKLKDQEEAPQEMTLEEICKELGIEIKITKE